MSSARKTPSATVGDNQKRPGPSHTFALLTKLSLLAQADVGGGHVRRYVGMRSCERRLALLDLNQLICYL